MKIVVFGTGYVGSAIVRELADRGHEVTAVSRSGKTDLPAPVASVAGSVHDPAFLASATAKADALVCALPAVSPDGGLAAAVTDLLPRRGGRRSPPRGRRRRLDHPPVRRRSPRG